MVLALKAVGTSSPRAEATNASCSYLLTYLQIKLANQRKFTDGTRRRETSPRCLGRTPIFTSETLGYMTLCLSVCLSVCVCVCLNQPSWFLAWELHSTLPTLCFKEIQVSPKIRVLPSGTLPQTLDLENFAMAYRSSLWTYVLFASLMTGHCVNTWRRLRNRKCVTCRARKCVDIIGTVLVPWAGQWPFPMQKYKCIFQIKYTEAILSNSIRKLLWFEITRMMIAVLKQ